VQPAVEPLLVPADEAARLVGLGRSTFFRLRARGKTPAPLKLGGRVLYRLADLREWVRFGCPDRKTFEARRAAANGSGRPR
jgi:excisionase family DNA binding protein